MNGLPPPAFLQTGMGQKTLPAFGAADGGDSEEGAAKAAEWEEL